MDKLQVTVVCCISYSGNGVQSKNIHSISCQNVSSAQESACPLHRDMNPRGVCWGNVDLAVMQKSLRNSWNTLKFQHLQSGTKKKKKSPESANVVLPVQTKYTEEIEWVYKQKKPTVLTASSRTLLITAFKIPHSNVLCLGASPGDLTAHPAAVLQNLGSFMAQTCTTANVLREENLTGF